MVLPVSSSASQISPVTDALRQAADQTGVSFDYLLRTASRESSLDPNAKALTSSASGLFQFIEQTWLSIVKEAGAQLGFSREAGAISRQPDGRLTVADQNEKQRILSLRNDPNASAVFGAAFTQRNVEQLSRDLGRTPDAGETYLAHVLGASGAARFIGLANLKQDAPAAASFPEAARANRAVFFKPNGQARSFGEVQQQLTKYHLAVSNPVLALQEAGQADSDGQPGGEGQSRSGVFQSLFQPEGRGPVSKLVQSLWGQGGRANALASYAPQPARPAFFPSVALSAGLAPNRPVGATGANTSDRPASQASLASSGPASSSSPAPSAAPGAPLNLLFFLKLRG